MLVVNTATGRSASVSVNKRQQQLHPSYRALLRSKCLGVPQSGANSDSYSDELPAVNNDPAAAYDSDPLPPMDKPMKFPKLSCHKPVIPVITFLTPPD